MIPEWDDIPQKSVYVSDKYVLPPCFAVLAFAAWWYGWLDPIMRIVHDVTGWN
jgi:hypothetical protein